MNLRWLLVPAVAPLLACGAASPPPPAAPATATATASPEPAPVGGQRDAHGCLGPAGYSWSALRKSCLRLFEEGLRLDAATPSDGANLSAFLLFSGADRSVAGNSAVELVTPDGASLILTRSHEKGPYLAAGAPWEVRVEGGAWTVYRAGAILYRPAQ